MARARPRRVPLLDRLAAHPPGGTRPRERGRARLLRPARRRAARERDHAVPDALPLGPAAGARGRGRLDGARDRRGVRRVRRRRRRTARRPRHALDHAQRAVGRRPGSATRGACTRPGGRARPTPSRPRTICCSRTAGRSTCCAARRPTREVGIALNLAHVDPASDSPEDARRRARSTAIANRWFLDPLFRGEYPADMLERFARRAAGAATATSRRSRRRSTSSASTTTSASSSRAGPNGDGPHVVARSRRAPVHRHGLGGLSRRVSTSCSCASRDDYAPPAIYVTENGAAFGDVRGHDGRVHDPERTAYLAAHIDAVGRAHRGRRAGAGLLRLEPARQLRVGPRLLEAVRDRLRRLSDARARAEGQLRLVPRLHREPSSLRQPSLTGAGDEPHRPDALHGSRRVRARFRGRAARGRARSATTASSSSTCTATTPALVRGWLDEHGLVAAGRHAGLDALEHELPALADGAARARDATASR